MCECICLYLFFWEIITVQDGGITTISIDGNFGLVRKHHSGISPRGPSTVESSFFMEDDEVEAFVNSYQNDKQTDQVINSRSWVPNLGSNLIYTMAIKCVNALAYNAIDIRACLVVASRYHFEANNCLSLGEIGSLFLIKKHNCGLWYPCLHLDNIS